MKHLVAIPLYLLLTSLVGQDEQARRILDKLNDRYSAYTTLEINFELEIDYPERAVEKQTGLLIQDGIKYVFKSADQEIYGNGKDIWLYLVARNEVQINNYEEDEDGLSIVTPKDLLRQYESGRFKYAITDAKAGRTYIEFVPLDDDSEYSKFRLTISDEGRELESVHAFGLDGSRILFKIMSLTANKSYQDDVFNFDPSKHPGVFVEDLRID